jgi:D-psicose/D-tagatose/L-ribulose 3-epimerase
MQSHRTYGVNTWVWCSPLTDERLAELAPRIAGWGFDAIELPVEDLGDWDPKRTSSLLDSLGLSPTLVFAMGEGRELVAADSTVIEATRDYMRRVIDLAHAVSARVVAGPAYASVGRTWRMSPTERLGCYLQLRDGLAPVVEHARQAGAVVAVEPLNRFETSVLNTVDQALEALDGLAPEACGLALDTFHMNIEERDLPAAVRRAGSRVAHVQVCANDRGAPGADHLDWRGFLAALDEVGYDGPLNIESFSGDNKTIATAASIWRPLAADQDAIAVDGLAFLSGLDGEEATMR